MAHSHPPSIRTAAAVLLLGLCAAFGTPGQTAAQVINPDDAEPALTLTLEEAMEIALVNNYTLQNARLDVASADAQVREAWGQVLPQVNASSSYTRNLKSPNPFAGSDAGDLFRNLGLVEWLIENEEARTDDDPTTVPISLQEFLDRMQPAPGAGDSDANPFNVPNQFSAGISVEQTLFNGSAFAAIQGAQRLKDINQFGADRQEQLLIDEVREAYYRALFAEEQARVAIQSVTRTQRTLEEVAQRVTQGVAPKFQRLSAEVELSNLETQLVQIQNQAALALDNLKLTLGVPMEQPIRLRGDLDAAERGTYLTVSVEDAVETALLQRPDLKQALLAVELREVDKSITQAQYLPLVTAFLNANYTGSVPDARDNAFFSQNYWNPGVSAGVRLTWNLFNGFQTSAQVQQRQIAIERAENELAQLTQAVQLEVEGALRSLKTALQRVQTQEQNVARAELNYEYAQARLREGVASQLEEREASEQLDQSRLNYLQAVYDYLESKSAFETAVGVPLAEPIDFRLTSN